MINPVANDSWRVAGPPNSFEMPRDTDGRRPLNVLWDRADRLRIT